MSFQPWLQKSPQDLAEQKALQALLAVKARASFGADSYVSPQAGIFTQSFKLGVRSWVASGVIIRGNVEIGGDTSVNPYTHIAGNVRIGNGCRIASNVSIFGFNHGFDRIDVPIKDQPVTSKGIVIHNDVWIGANAVIVDGVEIGPHCIVAAGAVVTRNVPAYKVVGGNPARVLRDRTEAVAAAETGLMGAAPAPAGAAQAAAPQAGPAAVTGKAPAPDPKRRVRSLLYAEDPYFALEKVFPPDMQGWDSHNPIFERVIAEVRPAVIVEVGTWKGASAIHMATLCKRIGIDPEIVCVDTWLGNWQHWARKEGVGSRIDLRLKNGFPNLYFQFMSNVLSQNCGDMITPLPLTGVAGAKLFAHLAVRPDMVYIDGDHEYESVIFDLRGWLAQLSPRGVLVGDDYMWPGVKKAADEIAEDPAWSLEVTGNKFIIRRA